MWYNNRNAAIVRLDRLIQRRKFGKGAISILRDMVQSYHVR